MPGSALTVKISFTPASNVQKPIVSPVSMSSTQTPQTRLPASIEERCLQDVPPIPASLMRTFEELGDILSYLLIQERLHFLIEIKWTAVASSSYWRPKG